MVYSIGGVNMGNNAIWYIVYAVLTWGNNAIWYIV